MTDTLPFSEAKQCSYGALQDRSSQNSPIPSAAQFRAARGALGLTMTELSARFPITTNVIWKAEQNVRLHISDMMLQRLQRAYESIGITFYSDEESEAVWLTLERPDRLAHRSGR